MEQKVIFSVCAFYLQKLINWLLYDDDDDDDGDDDDDDDGVKTIM